MEILPRTMGTRPRLACEVRAEGVVAARAHDASALLDAVSQVALADGIVAPRVPVGEPGVTVASEAGNSAASGVIAALGGGPAGRKALVDAMRSALEAVTLKDRDVTLVVPDAAVRVLLLDFDELPTQSAEALSIVRFRLKKLLPFDADDAAVSYQVMSSVRGVMQVIAVAMPKQVLADYESVVREAGFEPGAVLPSTLAAVAGLGDDEIPVLVVNAGREGVTTAIVKGGVLLLHRTVDLGGRKASGESDDSRSQDMTSSTARLAEPEYESGNQQQPLETSIAAIAARMAAAAAPNAASSTEIPASTAPEVITQASAAAPKDEVAQAVSVAAAYFEDTLQAAPAVVLSAGPMGAPALIAVLDDGAIGGAVGPMAVQEMVDRAMLGAGATSAGQAGGVPLGWLAGVRGALAN
jgi:type IV pilus assembly protein PilM